MLLVRCLWIVRTARTARTEQEVAAGQALSVQEQRGQVHAGQHGHRLHGVRELVQVQHRVDALTSHLRARAQAHPVQIVYRTAAQASTKTGLQETSVAYKHVHPYLPSAPKFLLSRGASSICACPLRTPSLPMLLLNSSGCRARSTTSEP
jgi:hypothetical protein